MQTIKSNIQSATVESDERRKDKKNCSGNG